MCAYRFEGRRFDCGSKLGYLAATVHFGLKHPEVGGEFAEILAHADLRAAVPTSIRLPASTDPALEETLVIATQPLMPRARGLTAG